jgi:hypothetical protein
MRRIPDSAAIEVRVEQQLSLRGLESVRVAEKSQSFTSSSERRAPLGRLGVDEQWYPVAGRHPERHGATGRGRRNATRCQRAISQPFERLSPTQSGKPRNDPVMRAVDGPPQSSVHAVTGGVGRNADRPRRCSLRQARAESGTVPVARPAQRSVRICRGEPLSARKSIRRAIEPAEAAVGNAAHTMTIEIRSRRRCIRQRIRREPGSFRARLAGWL